LCQISTFQWWIIFSSISFVPFWSIFWDFNHPLLRVMIARAAIVARSNWIMDQSNLMINKIITKPLIRRIFGVKNGCLRPDQQNSSQYYLKNYQKAHRKWWGQFHGPGHSNRAHA
jgi:hypothetical protein